MTGLFNRRLIRATFAEANAEWFLKGVYWRDQDVTDTPIEFTPGQSVEGLDVVFTKKATELTGLVRDDKGQSRDRQRHRRLPWRFERVGGQSRFVRTSRVDQDGRFRLKNLPPYDDYRVIAVRDWKKDGGRILNFSSRSAIWRYGCARVKDKPRFRT